MKVYLLQYCYYEDSETQGVYTQEAMEREKKTYVEEGRKMQQRDIEYKKSQIASLEQKKKKVNLKLLDKKLNQLRNHKKQGNKTKKNKIKLFEIFLNNIT